MTKPEFHLLLSVVAAVGCFHFDRGFHVVVSRPVAGPVARACIAAALASDSSFRGVDTIAQPWLVREAPNALGSFSWQSPADAFRDYAEIRQTRTPGNDTISASAGWIGREPTKAQIAVAAKQLMMRVDTTAERCGTPLAPAFVLILQAATPIGRARTPGNDVSLMRQSRETRAIRG